jgi:hypothetical protein
MDKVYFEAVCALTVLFIEAMYSNIVMIMEIVCSLPVSFTEVVSFFLSRDESSDLFHE